MQQKRVEYWKAVREIKPENLVFIDESGVNLAIVRLYARALKGTRARGERPQKRGRNISVIGALSVEKVLAITNVYGTVDGVTFEAFIVKELVPKLWKDACVIMDNAKIHLGEMVREAIETAGANLRYLSISHKLSLYSRCQEAFSRWLKEKRLRPSLPVRKGGNNQLNVGFSLSFNNP